MSTSVPVTNGKYEVALKFAEMYHNGGDQRRFNVDVEGSRRLTNYDVYAAAGGAKRAVERRYLVDVKDGDVDVNFSNGTRDRPATAGVEVKKLYFGDDFEGTYVSNGTLKGWESLVSQVGGIAFNNSGSSTYAYQKVVDKDGRKALYARVLDDDPSTAYSATTRAQMSLIFGEDKRQEVYHSSHRMLLGYDLGYLKNYSGSIGWFTIFEIWNRVMPGVSGNTAGSARWGIGIHKGTGVGSALYWELEGQYMQDATKQFDDLFTPVRNTSVAIPFGKWVTLDFYFKRGTGSNGQIRVTMTPDGGVTQTLFDIRNHTVYPGRSDLYLHAWQPMKLYLDDKLLDWMRSKGKRVEAWYNDFRWYK
jgi:hypothetical protein